MDIEFTDHIKKRLKKRKIKESKIIDAIIHPDKEYKLEGKIYVQKNSSRGKVEIVIRKINI